MKIVAVDEHLRLLDTYDLGSKASTGPDHYKFNCDISKKGSPVYFMEVGDYEFQLKQRALGKAESLERTRRSKKALRRVQ